MIFRGALGTAAAVAQRKQWVPGAWCDVGQFCCSAWYEPARLWLLHERWRILPAEEFVNRACAVIAELGAGNSVFVRPDSPLKPFSGRVLSRKQVSLAALDHGFYYDDASIPVIVAPVREVGREWRFVVVQSRVVAGSAYDAAHRSAISESANGPAWQFAAEVAAHLPPPEEVYLLDVCEADGALRLLELNPFSGAELYACSAAEVVASVSRVGLEAWERRDGGCEC